MYYIDQTFEIGGGVPKRLKTNNMKTVMNDARTDYKKESSTNSFNSSQIIMDLKFIHVLQDTLEVRKRLKPR